MAALQKHQKNTLCRCFKQGFFVNDATNPPPKKKGIFSLKSEQVQGAIER